MHMVLAVLSGGTRIIWLFFAPEITWGIVQLVGYFMQRATKNGTNTFRPTSGQVVFESPGD
jgi:hypothetical protein